MGVRAAVKFHEVLVQVTATALRLGEHRVESVTFGLQERDLALGPIPRLDDERAPLVWIVGRAEAVAVTLAGNLVLQQLTNLGEAEARIVTQASNESQTLQVRCVVQPIGAIRAGRRLQQPEFFVVADGPSRQAGLGGDFLDAQESGGRIGHPPMLPQP